MDLRVKKRKKGDKMIKRWQLVVARKEKVCEGHEIELSHNQSRTDWYVCVTNGFYTEFTFNSERDAVNFYNLTIKAANIYMDVLSIN